MICSNIDCDRLVTARGMCHKHYSQWHRLGLSLDLSKSHRIPLETRFWLKVNKTDTCWLWTGAKAKGYGHIWDADIREKRKSHRVAWELCKGNIPDGLFVLHRCDNPKCVNPKHLFLGTQKDNMQDCANKGRAANQNV